MRLLLLIFTFAAFTSSSIAQLQANFNLCRFNSPNGPYVESYLNINNNSVVIKDSNEVGQVLATIIFRQGEKVFAFEKYELLVPVSNDSMLYNNVTDQKRFKLDNGSYELDISLDDLNDDLPASSHTQKVEIDFPQNTMVVSDIEYIESISKSKEKSPYSKSGYDILPYVADFYPAEIEKIGFYAEVYNADKILKEGDKYLINYFIEDAEKNQVVADFKGFIRADRQPVNVVLSFFDITNLPSGNYNLVIEARSKENDVLVSKKRFFQRSNPYASTTPKVLADFEKSWISDVNNPDTLREYILCLAPISDPLEIEFAENQLKTREIDLLQQYIFNFWIKRDPYDPQGAWATYKKKVNEVNKFYSTSIKKGYETDRGRVYLKYDPPNTITRSYNEPSAYPYEIWHYYKVPQTNQSNRRFVFYNRDLITNDFELLHTDVFGELNNPNWKTQLYKRTTNYQDPATNDFRKHYGSRVEQNYELPR